MLQAQSYFVVSIIVCLVLVCPVKLKNEPKLGYSFLLQPSMFWDY